MKLIVYDLPTCEQLQPNKKGQSKRAIAFSAVTGVVSFHANLCEQIKLQEGMRVIFVHDEDKPKDWYFMLTEDERGFSLRDRYKSRKDKTVKRLTLFFLNKTIVGILQKSLGFKKCATYLVAKEPTVIDGHEYYRILTNINLMDSVVLKKRKIEL